jgi:GMP synthase-like glutamine amidotransferase
MKKIKIAVLDLNEGVKNEGMRCIREIISSIILEKEQTLSWDEFEVRKKIEIPNLEYDIYISSGGPGSPNESEGSEWENKYFSWLNSIESWNENPNNANKKFVFFICHSFQLACRYFKVAQVIKRKSIAFGIFPIHMLNHQGMTDPIFHGLKDPFFGVDSREYQVVQPDSTTLEEIGAEVLCIEKERPHVALERAVMAIRFNSYMVGTQFHPEADVLGMSNYLHRDEKKEMFLEIYGQEKWESMLEHLNDPDKISLTNSCIVPNFIRQSIAAINEAND